jgi:hypothetical protein
MSMDPPAESADHDQPTAARTAIAVSPSLSGAVVAVALLNGSALSPSSACVSRAAFPGRARVGLATTLPIAKICAAALQNAYGYLREANRAVVASTSFIGTAAVRSD